MFHPHSLQPGNVFAGDFRIERPLAIGGMGAVYVAEQLSTGRRRALKLMLPTLVQNSRTRERFEQEARVASRIASDHVVEVVAAGVDTASGAPWLAMELLEGQTLTARIEQRGALAPHETLEVFRQLCHALGAAHAIGLVHRDIKPENLYLAFPRREGVPFTLKVLDFGIAKLTEDVRGHGGLTGAVGSPLWMAPEQTSSAAVQPATDVWALGLVAFYCLTGRSYWRAANASDATLQGLLKEMLVDPLEPASVRASALGAAQQLPPAFDAWFARSTARDPSERYPDAAQAFAALGPVLGPAPAVSVTAPTAAAISPVAASPSTADQSKKLLRWVVAILALFVLGGLGMAAIAGVMFGFLYSSARAGDQGSTPSPRAVPAAPLAKVDAAPNVEPESSEQAQGPPSGGKSSNKALPASTADASDEPKDARVSYRLGMYRSNITLCWKGNEGAKPDAGSFSATITVTIGKVGRADKVIVQPRTYPRFAACATRTSAEHPWGPGPVETKSFSFNF